MPPEELQYRVGGSRDPAAFLHIGRHCAQDIEGSLARVGRTLGSFQRVLDFGCGCGRTLRWYSGATGPQFFGSDIDAEAIAWCRDNLEFARFSINDPQPPLSFPAEFFDLVYSISVFSHLEGDYQTRWAREINRVTRAGGIVLLTLHGRFIYQKHINPDPGDLDRSGFLYLPCDGWKDIFPPWYGNAFYSEAQARKHFGRHFTVLEYIPGGMGRYQDLIVLQKSVAERPEPD